MVWIYGNIDCPSMNGGFLPSLGLNTLCSVDLFHFGLTLCTLAKMHLVSCTIHNPCFTTTCLFLKPSGILTRILQKKLLTFQKKITHEINPCGPHGSFYFRPIKRSPHILSAFPFVLRPVYIAAACPRPWRMCGPWPAICIARPPAPDPQKNL